MKVVAFLPAKRKSNRINNKNIRLLDGKPLFLHTLDNLKECKLIDEIYLDSESDELFKLAEEYPCIPLRRSPELASNKIDGNKLFYNEISKVDADIYMQILCTSPFILPTTIDKAVEILINSDGKYDSVILVKNAKLYTWKNGTPSYDINQIPNSNTLDDTVIETMGLYVIDNKAAHSLKRRIGDSPYFLEADEIEAIDVNYPKDFELANYIMAGMREASNVKFRNLSRLLSSAMLSDIMDDLGVNAFIGGYELNMQNKKILGRAKTMKIRELNEGENYSGIYGALNSYDNVVPGDIIVIENGVPEYAYFGGLNANLAIRQGAIGAVIGGQTRDYNEVKNLDFPVFSKGHSARDVRRRATVSNINKTVLIDGVSISPGDIVFADFDGVIVIPIALEKEVFSLAMETIRKENKIIQDIARSISGTDLLQNHGEF